MMFAIISQLIVQAVGKIIGTSIDLASKNISRRSSLAAKLVNLFSYLAELEKTSQELYKNLVLIANGREPVTEIAKVPLGRLNVGKGLDGFKKAVNDFRRQLKELETLLGIYQSDLHYELEALNVSKGIYLKAADLFVMTCPWMRSSADLSTGFILFPRTIPDQASVNKLITEFKMLVEKEGKTTNHWPEDKVKSWSDMLTQMYLAKMNMKEAHIHSLSDVREIIDHAERDISAIRDARIRLADFIKTNLPFEKIFS